MKQLLWGTLFIILACSPSRKSTSDLEEDRTQELITHMTGTFDSGLQAQSNSKYYNISLHMYPMWTDRTDGRWLYVEQAVASNPAEPYRQRMYQVLKTSKGYESRVFELPDPENSVGAWKGGTSVDNLSPEDLILREGCTVYLDYNSQTGTFEGKTKSGQCLSSLRGATYAESEVVIHPDYIQSWDRGFDANGQQVWGATDGPYVFRRSVDFPD